MFKKIIAIVIILTSAPLLIKGKITSLNPFDAA